MLLLSTGAERQMEGSRTQLQLHTWTQHITEIPSRTFVLGDLGVWRRIVLPRSYWEEEMSLCHICSVWMLQYVLTRCLTCSEKTKIV